VNRALSDLLSIIGKSLAKSIKVAAFVFMLVPILIAIYQSFLPTVAFEAFPKDGFTLRWFRILFQPEFLRAVGISLMIATLATGISLVCGIFAALVLARTNFKGRELVNMLFLSPIMIPPVVKGISFIFYFVIIGLRPGLTSLFLAHVVITLPYVIRVVYPCFYGLDRSLEDASRNLGANEFQTFLRVTLPLIKPGVLSGAIFGFIMSIDDVGVSIFLITPETVNLAVLLLTWSRSIADNTLAAISTALVLVTFAVSVLAEKLVGLDSILGGLRH